jgi:mannosyl-3-phosphoglycerate phosphatase
MKTVILTDLDGTLLDHGNYSYRGALPALERIRRDALPLIFVTSKTRSEVEALHDEMRLDEPFVVENGGGIYYPPRYASLEIAGAEPAGRYRLAALGKPYEEIRAFFARVRDRFDLRGFGDLHLHEIGACTGLDEEAATRARCREFSEPFMIGDESGLPELSALALGSGFRIERGGRFHHLVGAGQDKGAAVRHLQQAFRSKCAEPVRFVGLGDGPNDLPMLREVDVAVLVPNPAGRKMDESVPGMIEARLPGSRGWGEALLEHGILEPNTGS